MSIEQRKFSLEKQPAEKLTIGTDFENDLGIGEAITSAEISAIDLNDGSDAGSLILDGTYSINSSQVLQKVKAGADGRRYQITMRAATDAAHVFEADIVMTVCEL